MERLMKKTRAVLHYGVTHASRHVQKIRQNSSNIWLLSLEEIVGVKRH